jgi:hypothetical protein
LDALAGPAIAPKGESAMSLSLFNREPALITWMPTARPYQGHAHFWQRALSRRGLVQATVGVAALTVGSHVGLPYTASAMPMAGAMPKPIPGGIDLGGGLVLHINNPEDGVEPSTITDFRGFVGVSHAQGAGTVTTGGAAGGLSTPTVTGDRLVFDADVRFMQGRYVGEDGQEHTGTFAMV